jgi:dipeptidyl aminopeptidase/acylaminoacyl peptidase
MNSFRRALLPLLAALPLAAGAPPAASQGEGTSEPLGEVWSRPARGIVSLSVSPEGSRIVSVDARSTVRCFSEEGLLLWERHVADADAAATSRRGSLTLAFALRQPLAREVTFLDADGHPFYVLKPSEPVAFAEVSADGRYAAVASGRSVIFCGLTGSGVRPRVIRLKGEPRQVQFGPGDSLYVVTRTPDQVQLVKSTGRVLWTHAERGATGYTLSASQDGRLAAFGCERPDAWVVVALLDSAHRTRWRVNRRGRAPRVRLAASGAAVLLAYEHLITHTSRARFERRLAYLSTTQQDSWTRGGAYSTPLYVSLDRDGEWVVTLDTPRESASPLFRLLGRGGERRYYRPSPARVLIATASAEGRHIAVYRADGVLELLRVGEL